MAPLDLNGFAATVTSLNDGTGGGGHVTSSTPAALGIEPTALDTFDGDIQGSVRLLKEGTGNLLLTGYDVYSGGTKMTMGRCEWGVWT